MQSRDDGYVGTDRKVETLVGKQGICLTVLRPSGKVEIEGEMYDANALEGYIEKNKTIEVVRHSSSQIVVMAV